MAAIAIRSIGLDDREQWNTLYKGYADFYHVDQTPGMRDQVWSWLHDPAKETRGLVAQTNSTLVGLAHFRPFPRPLSATTGCYLDDLFVSPDARGAGAADALIDAVRAVAFGEGWSVLRWITAEDNYRGRGVYDRIATKTNWVTYDLKV